MAEAVHLEEECVTSVEAFCLGGYEGTSGVRGLDFLG